MPWPAQTDWALLFCGAADCCPGTPPVLVGLGPPTLIRDQDVTSVVYVVSRSEVTNDAGPVPVELAGKVKDVVAVIVNVSTMATLVV